jgi:hypothetical protein
MIERKGEGSEAVRRKLGGREKAIEKERCDTGRRSDVVRSKSPIYVTALSQSI